MGLHARTSCSPLCSTSAWACWARLPDFTVGQVVELNATSHGRVRLECNGERLMWCHLGKSQGKYTLRVDELVDREQEFMNEILSG